MAWQETIEALKNSGETDESLMDLYIRASRGESSARAAMVRLHDQNRYYMPIGATTAQDKCDDIMYALTKYFEDVGSQNEREGDSCMGQMNSSLSGDGAGKDAEKKSSVISDIAQLAQQPERKALLGELASAIGGILRGKKKEDAAEGQQGAEAAAEPGAATWKCDCGYDGNTRKFCAECGAPKPTPQQKMWKCSCGYAENTRKFCAECGKPKPKEETWQCEDCGTTNTRKFCPVCGKARPE